MTAIANQIYTLEEYFDLEQRSEEKWEFWDGQVWNMSGRANPMNVSFQTRFFIYEVYWDALVPFTRQI